MSTETRTAPVGDSVAKVDNELAVGEDLRFQSKWWKFEKWVWRFFALVVLADLLGAFGRGPLANAHFTSPDGALAIRYERIERFSTPSEFVIQLGAGAVHDGTVRLWVSDSMIMRLGNQRISPQPLQSLSIDGGVLYTFPANGVPGTVAFSLQPAYLGSSSITVRLQAGESHVTQDTFRTTVFVMP